MKKKVFLQKIERIFELGKNKINENTKFSDVEFRVGLSWSICLIKKILKDNRNPNL